MDTAPLTFDQKLSNLAQLAVTALGISAQNPRPLLVAAELDADAIELMHRIAEAGLAAGATCADFRFLNPRLAHLQLRAAPEASRLFISPQIAGQMQWIEQERPYIVRLSNNPHPGIMGDLPAALASAYDAALERALKPQRTMQFAPSLPWLVTTCASRGWAQRVFPEAHPDDALGMLWDALFRVTFADSADCTERFAKHMEALRSRRDRLNALAIMSLRFRSTRGTDLLVGLSPIAEWNGGPKATTDGHPFTANWPTFECFTTPDCRRTEGVAHLTRPIVVQGTIVCDGWLRFRKGVVVESGARTGGDALAALLSTDEGARRLGEIALVGLDAPIAQEGRVFCETLLDENAACHMAVGSSYIFALRNGAALSPEELAAVGRNSSLVHEDMMISDATTTVTALTYDGEELALIENGFWAEF